MTTATLVEPKADVEEMRRALCTLVEPGQVVELRALDVSTERYRKPHVEAGYYDPEHWHHLASAAEALTANATGVYVTINRVDRAVLARSQNRVREPKNGEATSDTNITELRWLMVDVDPERPAGICATDAEHTAARAVAAAVRHYATSVLGWPEPVRFDSGNGFYALWRIDLPRADSIRVKRCLEALAAMFDTPEAKVDVSTYNPARCIRLAGTVNRKGDSTADRPHRLCRLLHVPETISVVTCEQLEQLAATLPPEPARSAPQSGLTFNVDAFIRRHNLAVGPARDWHGATRWVFDVCPWNAEHTNRSAYLLKLPSGAVAAGCHHSSCRGKTWDDLRALYEPNGRAASESPVRVEVVRQQRPWPVLEPAARYGLAGEIVAAIDPHSEADPVGVLVTTLTFYGNVIGRTARTEVGGTEHHCNEFVTLVGDTSLSRKGTALAWPRRLAKQVDPDWYDRRVMGGLSSGEGLKYAVRDASKMCLKDGTPVDPGVDDKRLMVIEEELAGVLQVMAREGSTLSIAMREAWDGSKMSNLTRHDPFQATDPHISIVAHVTATELARYLTKTEAGNGFANRFLWVCVRRSKLLPSGGGQVDLCELGPRFAQAVTYGRSHGPLVERDAEAKRMWNAVYPELTTAKPGLVGSIVSRADSHTLRLSMIYAMLDRSPYIRPPHLAAALALWKYCEDSATYIFGKQFGDPVADGILELLNLYGARGADRTEISNHFGNHLSAARLQAALQSLSGAGVIREFVEHDGGRGRPRTVYVAAENIPLYFAG